MVRLGGILVFEEAEAAETWPFETWWVDRRIFEVWYGFDDVRGSFDENICHL